ncbi:MAG: alkaline phosphatase family protein, partial [Burkholderiales bacterium]|nr:alkaline phosphatase family protein [Burkholderiales bacterium]
FPNTPEFAKSRHMSADRIDAKKMIEALNTHLTEKFGSDKLILKWSSPSILLDYKLMEQKGLKREEVENAAARFLIGYDGIANAFTRTQLENGTLPATHLGKLMQRAWNRQVSGDILLVTKPYWYFGSGNSGTSHGSPYSYDTNVPLMIMGKPWFKAGNYGQYTEVVDLAPTLADLLRIRPPSASEGRILTEALR